MPKPKSEFTTAITFQGDDNDSLKDLLYYHADVVHEIWRHVSGAFNARIDVYVTPPDMRDVLEWSLQIRSPLGIQSFVVRRNRPTSPIQIIAQ